MLPLFIPSFLVLSMRQTLRERLSSALLSDPATTEDLIETLKGRDYKVIGCERIESCLEGKWIGRITHQSRPDQILENENIWLHGFEVSFITGDDEAQFLPKVTPSIQEEDDPGLDQWSDASSRQESSHISWSLPNEELVQPTTQPASALEIAAVVDPWDIIEAEPTGTPSINVEQSSSGDEEEEGSESTMTSQEQDIETQNHYLREEVKRLREQILKLGIMAKTVYKNEDTCPSAPEGLDLREQNRTLEKQNEQLTVESSTIRELNQQLREKKNIVSAENERLLLENSKLRDEICRTNNV
jgi:hypothetical protein